MTVSYKPSIYYDNIAKRWCVKGGAKDPVAYFPDENVGRSGAVRFYAVAHGTVAVGSLGSHAIATLAAVGVKEGDLVLVQGRTPGTLHIVGASVPSGGGQVWVEFANFVGAAVNQHADTYDVMAITFET